MTNNNIHPSHDHGLVKDDKCEGSYKCSGCKMRGIGKRYRCTESCCKFELHLECMQAEEKRKFLKQKFRLHTNPLQRPECTNEGGKCWSCDACGKKVRGFVYHCSETHQVFHPLCFPKLEYHPFHDHGLVKDDKCEGNYTCSGCKMRGIGKRYRCSESCCKFELHLECMHAEEKRTFQKQKLRLYKTPPPGCSFPMKDFCTECRCCNVCGEMVRGFVYHCSETNQDFHPPCTKLPSKVRIDDVTFLLKDEGPSSCAFCEKKTPRGKKITGWSYVSKLHKRGFHVCCAVNMISKEDSSLSLAGIENLHLLCKCKNGSTQSRSNWLIILKIFSKVVFSICLGDPAAIIFSAIDLVIN